jgi:hypothetical protein
MKSRSLAALAPLAALAALAALANVAVAQAPQTLPPARTTDAASTVTVRNERRHPAVVYQTLGQFDLRIGVVAPGATATLPLRVSGAATVTRPTLRLRARVQGEAGDLVTEPLAVAAPARLELTIPAADELASAPERAVAGALPLAATGEAAVTIDNPRDRAVTVYAEGGRHGIRLGRVPARGRATLALPKALTGRRESLRILLRPDGQLDLATDPVRIERGSQLTVQVPAM